MNNVQTLGPFLTGVADHRQLITDNWRGTPTPPYTPLGYKFH